MRRLLTVLGAIGTAVTIAPATAAAAQRYASPNGAGTACTSANQCSIRQAVEGASWNDEVIVAPGDYPLFTTLQTPVGMTIHGVAGQPRPRLLFSGPGQGGQGQQGLRVLAGSTLRYVEADQAPGSNWAALTAEQSMVDQVIAKGSGVWTADIQDSTMRDSVVLSSGTNNIALETGANGAGWSGTYRNVTAIATGSGGVAIQAFALTDWVSVLARNVIAHGGPGGHSLVARANPGATATITVGNSDWQDYWTDGAGASVADGGGNIGVPPIFVNAAAGDYRQAAGSPTIDAGLDEFFDGPVDVDGDPRVIGPVDIGADEFVVAPVATTGAATAVTKQSAALSGNVDAKQAPTTYHFEYGPTTAYGSSTTSADAGAGIGVAVAATLDGLSPATTYHYRLVATNAGGTAKGADKTFTTGALPSSPSTPATSTPATSTPATSTPSKPAATTPAALFGGVSLVSSRLRVARGFITVTLRCPSGTVGRCSGQTRLTARRAKSTVTLGRAPFSIAPGQEGKVRLRVSRGGRRLLGRVHRVAGRDTNAARNGAGQAKTTVAAVTIRRAG